jgi:putative transposase
VANYEKREWSNESGIPFPNWYMQKNKLKQHFCFINLLSQSAQEVLKVLQEAWVSFFELKKSGGITNPQPPRFNRQTSM